MKTDSHLIVCSIALLCSMPLVAQEPAAAEDTTLEQATLDSLLSAYSDSLEASYTYATGKVDLADGVASLNLPAEFKFLDAAQSKQVIENVWDNPPGTADAVLGMILPADAGVLDDTYTFVIEYDAMGYVNDEDAADIDYTELLEELKRDDAEDNRQRKEAGYGTLDLVGWASPPYYDGERKVLHWAKEFHAEDAETNTLNYNVRVLGRKGVLILNAVASMDHLAAVKANIPGVLSMATFNPGHTYAEFDSNIDEVAAWTVGGLVAGKVLAKAGILALMLKNIKLVILALVAAVGAAWKFITGRKKKEPEPPSNPAA